MSIKGIPPGGLPRKIIPFPNQNVDKKENKSAEKKVFDKELEKVQAQKNPVESTDKATGPQNILPIQPNYHVLSQLKST